MGHDAGELAGLASTFGVAGTSDVDALLALQPDCIVHTAMADDRIFEALADLERFLAAGINVVSSSPVMLQYPGAGRPHGRSGHRGGGEGRRLPLRQRCRSRASPTTRCPLVLSGVSERIEEVRCSEVLNYNTYNQPMVLFDIMGFGRDLHDVPMLLSPRAC